MSDVSPAPDAPPFWGLVAAISAISIAAVGFGHSIPLFSILLERYGASDFEIGLNTATASVAALLAIPFFPRLISRIGLRAFLVSCGLAMALAYAGLYVAGDTIALWYPLRFLLGLAGAGLFVGSEIWINTIAPPDQRGRIIGLYGTFLALGFAAGPLFIALLGTDGLAPFVVGIALFAGGTVPIAFTPAPRVAKEDTAHSFFRLLPKGPATFGAAAMFAGLEAAILVFLPLLALDRGWGEHIGAQAVTVYGLGVVALQYLIGRWSERVGYGRGLVICAGMGCAGAILFAVTSHSLVPLLTVLFIWGGVIAGLYTLGLTLIGDRLAPDQMAAGNTGFVFAYGVGAIIGPLGAGLARQAAGPLGLNIFLIVVSAAYLALTLARRRAKLP